MFEEFEKVFVKSVGREGTIVDKVIRNGHAEYIVEDINRINNEYPLYDCVDSDLEKISA